MYSKHDTPHIHYGRDIIPQRSHVLAQLLILLNNIVTDRTYTFLKLLCKQMMELTPIANIILENNYRK